MENDQGYFMGQKIFSYITEAKDWFRSEAPLSILWYYIIMTVTTMLLAPYGPFCVAIGFIFGLWVGLLIQIGALIISNIFIFGVGRYLLRDRVILCVCMCVCVCVCVCVGHFWSAFS
jgi:uncharacterized membrane protein YdjX (TVP38/TMEM64 family)